MPIYEYACQDCGHQLDVLQKLAEDPLTDCPSCGASSLKRLISAPQFRLKGGGWYETDFKTGDKRNLVEKKDGGKEQKKTETKSDAGESKSSDKVKKAGGSEAA